MDKGKKENIVLNRNFQFQQVYRKGQSYVSPLVITYVLEKQRGLVRYGITTSRKIGNAVERNRARRVIKAAVIELLPKIDKACDLVFVARKATGKVKSTKLYLVIYEQLKRNGIIL